MKSKKEKIIKEIEAGSAVHRFTVREKTALLFHGRFPIKEKIAILCFFLSGFVSLLYEICWIRKSSLVFGSTIYAASTVIAVFFGGLALGSFLSGRYIGKVGKPLYIYAIIELLIGVFALSNSFLFFWFDNVYTFVYPLVLPYFGFLSLIRFIIIAAILLPPTILIGATFPLFVHHFITSDRKLSFFIPYLYAINTFGAFLGCICCGFVMMKYVGISNSILSGAFINLGIGFTILAIRIYRDDKKSIAPEEDFKPDRRAAKRSHEIIIAVLFFISGFLALGYEILWTRYLTLIIYNTIYTYVLSVTMTLGGICAGSLITIFVLDRIKFPLKLFIVCQILTGLSILTILFLPYSFWSRALNTGNLHVQMGIISMIFLVPSLLAGISFPSVLRAVTHSHSMAGKRIGFMNSINTFGGILGSLCMAFIILPYAGLQNSIYLATFLSILAGIIALAVIEKSTPVFFKALCILLTAVLWLTLPAIFKTSLPRDFLAQKGNLIAFREGLNSNCAVVRNESGITTLEIDRLWQGQSEPTHQIMACHIPMISHANPRDVLVVGMGVGQVAERFLYYPVRSLTCVDIEKELIPLIKRYFNSAWLDDKRLSVVVDDGRNFLKHTNAKYDIISVEVGQPFRMGLASFYTQDFYRSAQSKLNTNGILCQFMPLVFFDVNQYKALLHTFISVFPQSVLWYNYYEFIIIGYKDTRCTLDGNRFASVTAVPKVSEDLEYSYWGGARYSLNKLGNFMGNYLCGPEKLREFAGNAILFTDDKPVLEYGIALHQIYSVDKIDTLLSSMQKHLDNPLAFLMHGSDSIRLEYVEEIRDLNLKNIIAMERYQTYFEHNNAVKYLQDAYALNPKNLAVLYELRNYYARQDDYLPAIRYCTEIVENNPTDTNAYKYIAYAYQTIDSTDKAVEWFIRSIGLGPDADSYNALGRLYLRKNEVDKAMAQFSKAVEIDPGNRDAVNNYNEAKKRFLKK